MGCDPASPKPPIDLRPIKGIRILFIHTLLLSNTPIIHLRHIHKMQLQFATCRIIRPHGGLCNAQANTFVDGKWYCSPCGHNIARHGPCNLCFGVSSMDPTNSVTFACCNSAVCMDCANKHVAMGKKECPWCR